MKKIKKIDVFKSSKIQLIILINTLENRIDELENSIKDRLYESFMEKLSEPDEIKRLKEENKKLRLKNRELKSILKDSLDEEV